MRKKRFSEDNFQNLNFKNNNSQTIFVCEKRKN